jgi:hypothetical protein
MRMTVLASWIACTVTPTDVQGQGQGHELGGLRTRAERTAYRETSSYDDVMAFVEQVARAAPNVHLTTFGYSFEGRGLPLLVVGDVRDATPEAVRAADKVRVFAQANIHAGEVCGKEALQMLLRSLANGEHAAWLDSVVLLIAPIYNADGNERVRLTNRGRQHGPVGGMGQRPNAQGLDLNRDHMKLESPEARSLVGLLNDYDPHLAIDLHTTNGTAHAYHLTYAAPLNPNTSTAILEFLRGELLPAVTRSVKATHDWDFYYYGNLPWRNSSAERGWYTFDHRPRFNNSYVGLRNRLAILGEAYAYATFEDRVTASLWFVEAIVDFVWRRASDVRRVVQAADAEPVVGTTLGPRATIAQSAESVEILLGEVAEDRNPYSGRPMMRRLDVRTPERMPEFGMFLPTEEARVPARYLVPEELGAVVQLLDDHGVRWRRLERATSLTVERFAIDSSTVAAREFQGHRERTLFGRYEQVEVTVPPGTVVVPVNQPLGRLVFSLLEPRSDDGVVTWNLVDDAVEEARHYPIVRSFNP